MQEPFPIGAVCGHLWKNTDGQLSFLQYAVGASPELVNFGLSLRKQVTPLGSAITADSHVQFCTLENLLPTVGFKSSLSSC